MISQVWAQEGEIEGY